VCGLLASLITFAPGRRDKLQALEIAGGARLHNVIVAAERGGMELFTRRVGG
jgi:chromosome segregation ATPase